MKNDKDKYYREYHNRFINVLLAFKNDFKKNELNTYVELLNNEDIVSSLFQNTAKDIFEYSSIYDVNIKIIDDIKILCFVTTHLYRIIEKDVKYTKKYLLFHIMIDRFKILLPYNHRYKMITKLIHMFKNLNSYDDLVEYNGKFGVFQILKTIYNIESETYKEGKQIVSPSLDNILEKIEKLKNEVGEVSLRDWDTSGSGKEF